jgi:hypothetical protein
VSAAFLNPSPLHGLGVQGAGFGASVRNLKDLLLTLFEVSAYGSALLLLPCAIAGLFGCTLSHILIPVLLGAVTGTVVLTGIAIREGWYFDHLSEGGVAPGRAEPPSASPPRVQAGAKPLKSRNAKGGHAMVLKEQEKEAA